MAHEIENMLYVGDAPWHKLGTKVEKNLSIEEAIKVAGLDWQVGLKPLMTTDGFEVEHQATYRTSDNSILGVVGPTYKPLQNSDAFKFFNPFLESGEAFIETAGSLRHGKRVWILAKINREDSVIVPQSDDRVSKYVLLSNSHDGTLAIRVGFTPIRVVCNNTLQLSFNDQASKLIRIRHTANAATNLEKVREIMNLANSEFESTAEQYKLLANTDILQADLEKYVKLVFNPKMVSGEEDGSSGRKSRVFDKVHNFFDKGRGNDMVGVKGTLWAAYNAVTEYIQYERGTDLNSRLNETWFGSGAQLNKRALDVAVTMAMAA